MRPLALLLLSEILRMAAFVAMRTQEGSYAPVEPI